MNFIGCYKNCRQDSKVHLNFLCTFDIFETLILLALHMWLPFLYLKENINIYSKHAWSFQVWHPKKDCVMHFYLGCVHMIPISCKLDACEIACISSIQKCYKHIKNTMTWSMTHEMNIVGSKKHNH
jgi:hypothetical protein